MNTSYLKRVIHVNVMYLALMLLSVSLKPAVSVKRIILTAYILRACPQPAIISEI